MKEIIREELMDKYMHNSILMNSLVEESEIQAYTYGYLDGYFNESIYLEYVNKKEKYKESYSKGYEEGSSDKLYIDKTVLAKQKEKFIKNLVTVDMLNNRNRQNFTEASQKIYDYYFENGEISLSDGSITIPKKRK